ncbi:MAG TPA: 2-amino-4-hydroxy-6-hydroxymethyldihydropteridine diphosphokinase, partial [Phaeodactylibacter sp.]|nr:2-amino-4-hydroxy-6-hydroxymethyldihydropteridine diphosphokinase [Phaeodactylibacter sp.]
MSSKHSVYLHLGSNLGDCIAMLQKATRMIAEQIGTICNASPYYETEPWGLSNQPN